MHLRASSYLCTKEEYANGSKRKQLSPDYILHHQHMVINTKQPYACLLIERYKIEVMFFLLVVATKTVFLCWTSDLFIMHTLTVFPENKDKDTVHFI